MPKKPTLIVDEIFDTVQDPTEQKYHVKMLIKACFEAQCKQSVRVFGVNKKFTSGFIKMELMSRKAPDVDYTVRIYPKTETV